MKKSITRARLLKLAVLGQLTACAVLAGLFLRLDLQVLPVMPTLRLTATPLFIYMAALLFGPVAGGAVGVCSDLLAFAIKPSGPFLPTVTVCAALSGILPGLFRRLVRRRAAWAALASAVTTITVSALNSVGFWMLKDLIWKEVPESFFAALFFPRLFTALVSSAVYAAILPPFVKLMLKNAALRGDAPDIGARIQTAPKAKDNVNHGEMP